MSYIHTGWGGKYLLSPKVVIKQTDRYNRIIKELDSLDTAFYRLRDIPPFSRTPEQWREKFKLSNGISRREAELIKIRNEDNPEYVKHWGL